MCFWNILLALLATISAYTPLCADERFDFDDHSRTPGKFDDFSKEPERRRGIPRPRVNTEEELLAEVSSYARTVYNLRSVRGDQKAYWEKQVTIQAERLAAQLTENAESLNSDLRLNIYDRLRDLVRTPELNSALALYGVSLKRFEKLFPPGAFEPGGFWGAESEETLFRLGRTLHDFGRHDRWVNFGDLQKVLKVMTKEGMKKFLEDSTSGRSKNETDKLAYLLYEDRFGEALRSFELKELDSIPDSAHGLIWRKLAPRLGFSEVEVSQPEKVLRFLLAASKEKEALSLPNAEEDAIVAISDEYLDNLIKKNPLNWSKGQLAILKSKLKTIKAGWHVEELKLRYRTATGDGPLGITPRSKEFLLPILDKFVDKELGGKLTAKSSTEEIIRFLERPEVYRWIPPHVLRTLEFERK